MVVDKKLVKPKLVVKRGMPGRPPKVTPKMAAATPAVIKPAPPPNNNKWLLPPPPMPKMSQICSDKENTNLVESVRFLQFVGPSCGHHASYSFYKAIKYVKNGQTKILSLGEFFFVKIWPNSDLVAIGELQLLWEDKNTDQTLSSLRLYFLPEYTPEGRMHYHGEVRRPTLIISSIIILARVSSLCITICALRCIMKLGAANNGIKYTLN